MSILHSTDDDHMRGSSSTWLTSKECVLLSIMTVPRFSPMASIERNQFNPAMKKEKRESDSEMDATDVGLGAVALGN
ncbi:hypothetical protein SDJN02_07724 [Cucurbita argyrosperma subsp. argyrosperma]|nr:hypothetical protein SDJN02_07724 [Cucurbita argyrosperma subsp. argyrosperma]